MDNLEDNEQEWQWADGVWERLAEDALKDDWEHPDNYCWDEYYDDLNQA